MGRTLTQLVQGVAANMSDRSRFVTNTGTGGIGTWTDATNLADMPADWYNNMWLYHVNDAKEWRVTDDSGGGALTLDPTTTPTNTSDYELLPARPSTIVRAINTAAEQLVGRLHRTVIDLSYVTDSPIFNASFEDTTSATAINGWEKVTTTMTRETTADKKLGGQYSLRLDTASGYARPTAEFRDLLLPLAGYKPTLYVPCKTSTASAGRVSLVLDGVETFSSYHSGGGGWELLEVSASVADPIDTVELRLYRDAGTVYYDNIWMAGGPQMAVYRAPVSMPHGPSSIRIIPTYNREAFWHNMTGKLWASWLWEREEDIGGTTRGSIRVVRAPRSEGRWLMEGKAPLSELSARTDVAELDKDSAELLEVTAAIILLETSAHPVHLQKLILLRQRAARLEKAVPEISSAVQLPTY